MGWLASIFVALLTGGLGLFLGGLVANACVSWYRISSFEGKSGFFVVTMALLGAIAGLVIGLVSSRVAVAAGHPGFFKGLGIAWGVSLLIAAVIALLCRLLADIPPELDGRDLDLQVEIRLPVGQELPESVDESKTFLRLGSVVYGRYRKSTMGKLHVDRARQEDGRWIIPGTVYLFTQRGQRMFDADLNGQSLGGFVVPLPAKPGTEHMQWSDWLPKPRTGEAWPDSKASYRFRVAHWQAPQPPQP